MAEPEKGFAFKFRNDALRQHFAQFDSPLVERVNVPNGPLGKDIVLVKRDKLAERFGSQPVREE